MADTTFTDGVTVTAADWFNDVNRLHYTIFGDPSTGAALLNTMIAALTADTAPDPTADYVATLDASASTGKKVLLNKLVQFKIGTTTRDTSIASGAGSAVTGFGFKPRLMLFLTGTTGGIAGFGTSIGVSDGTNHYVIGMEASNQWNVLTTHCVDFFDSGGGSCRATVAFNADGFTPTYTKGGSPTATLTIIYVAFG